jgi:hypothetical protein
MKKMLIIGTLLAGVSTHAIASPGEKYQKGAYFLGFGLRGADVCNLCREKMGKILKVFTSPELVKFYNAYAKTVKQLGTEGAEAFNRAVFEEGISVACDRLNQSIN